MEKKNDLNLTHMWPAYYRTGRANIGAQNFWRPLCNHCLWVFESWERGFLGFLNFFFFVIVEGSGQRMSTRELEFRRRVWGRCWREGRRRGFGVGVGARRLKLHKNKIKNKKQKRKDMEKVNAWAFWSFHLQNSKRKLNFAGMGLIENFWKLETLINKRF